MSFLKGVNQVRRRLSQYLTKNIGNAHASHNIDANENIMIKSVLISRPNHRLGNLLLITPIVKEVVAIFPDCKIDLFLKGNLGPIVFKNYKNIDEIISLPRKPFKALFNYFKVWQSLKKKHYDLVINAVEKSSSGKISTKITRSKYKVYGKVEEDFKIQYNNYEHIAKKPVYSLRSYLAQFGFSFVNDKIPSIDLKLSDTELAKGRKIVDDLVNPNKKTICLFTYATDDKCYSETWWLNFYEKLKAQFTDYNFLEVLPVENISMLNFKIPSFYSKDIREICSVIANTAVFIGADSGIMHLASASQTPTVGLFSRPNQKEYQPFNNKGVAINTNNISNVECVNIIKKILDY